MATCQLNLLKDCVTSRDLSSKLAEIPRSLDGVYARILENIPEIQKEHVVRILQLLVFSQRPLTMKEVRQALYVVTEPADGEPAFSLEDTQNGDPGVVSRICSSLVSEETSEDLRIRLAHASVKQYLLSDRLPDGFKDKFVEIPARISVAKVCLRYLLQVVKENHYLHQKNMLEIYPFVKWAAASWVNQARNIEVERAVLPEIMELFEPERLINGPHTIWTRLIRNELPSEDLSSFSFRIPLAAHLGLPLTVKSLLDNPDIGDLPLLSRALSEGSFRGHLEVVQVLLNSGVAVNERLPFVIWSLGNTRLFEILIGRVENDFSVEYYTNLLATVLQSLRGCYDPTIRKLIGLGAKVDLQGRDWFHFRDRSLFKLYQERKNDLINLLISNGLTIDQWVHVANTARVAGIVVVGPTATFLSHKDTSVAARYSELQESSSRWCDQFAMSTRQSGWT